MQGLEKKVVVARVHAIKFNFACPVRSCLVQKLLLAASALYYATISARNG